MGNAALCAYFLKPMRDTENAMEAAQREDRRALGLLVRIRFVHIALQSVLLFPALRYGWMFPSDLPWCLGALGALLLFNLVSLAWLRSGRGTPASFLTLQTAVDLAAMTLIFGVSGGLTNPLHSLVHFEIGLAGILLPTLPATVTLALGAAALAGLGWNVQSLSDPYAWIGPLGPNLAYEWLLALAVSGLSIFAARRARVYRDRLAASDARARQRDRLRAAGAVASGFCHELASPLNAAGLLADRLRRKTGGTQSGDALGEEWDELKESLERCDHVVRAMAGAAWDPDELSLQTADAGAMLRSLATAWRGKVPLRIEGAEASLRVAAPAVGLAQTLQSLLRNADEASPASGSVDVSISSREGSVLVLVSDRGPGVEPGVLVALGSPFNSRKGKGRGLGLFSALHFAEALGGSLTLTARPGGGTEARLVLPRAAEVSEISETSETA
jgi:two-component system sensor histidine kinase RegB